MKKTPISLNFFLILFLIVLVSTGCKNMKAPANSESFTPIDNSSKGDLTMFTADHLAHTATYLATDSGCYRGSYCPEQDGSNIFFIDYASKKKVYLSDNVTGNYWTEDDTSFFQNAGAMTFASDNHYLYVYVPFGSSDTSSYCALYRMNMDGQNRKELFRHGGEYSQIDSGLVYNDKYLYFLFTEITEEGQKVTRICALDKENGGDLQTIFSYEPGFSSRFILGAFGRELVIKEIIPDEEENYYAQRHRLFLFNIDTGVTEDIMQWQQDDIQELVDGELLYYFDMEKQQILLRNLKDHTEEVLWDKIPFTVNENSMVYVEDKIHDGCLFAQTGENRYALNLETKEVLQLTLKGSQELGDGYLTILGASDDKYLVLNDYGQRKVYVKNHIEGSTGDDIVYYPIYSMIKKDDFLHNRPVFEPIEDMEIDEDTIVRSSTAQ